MTRAADEQSAAARPPARNRARIELADRFFWGALFVLGGVYVVLIAAMLIADAVYMVGESLEGPSPILTALADRRIQYSIWLSLISCSLSAVLSLVVAVPMGYVLSRRRFFGRNLIDAVLDIPIVLPPLVVGLSLLILFQFPPFDSLAPSVVYQVPAVVLAQFTVACAFAVRTMKSTFDHIDPRREQVALTLGCTQAEAFSWVVLPAARRGMVTALTLAWARSLGEFGPLLMFAGATRMKTEVLSTSIFLEMSVGNLEAAVAVSLIMVAAAVTVLTMARLWGARGAEL